MFSSTIETAANERKEYDDNKKSAVETRVYLFEKQSGYYQN